MLVDLPQYFCNEANLTLILHGACAPTLQGRLNGAQDFSIERTTSGKSSSLKVFLDGVEQTKQAMKLTQAQVDEMFAADLLPKTCCFNQEQLLGLLSVSS
jgi:hypothetical protein